MATEMSAQREELLGGRYEPLSLLGAGAAANVYRVRDVRTGAVRAAKVLKQEHAAKGDVLARFEDEYRILRTLHHPHLPEVYDYGWTSEGGRFQVMELVEGDSLDRYFQAHPEDIWVTLYELCEVLVFVHGHYLLHQDIKPSNILVARAAASGGERPVIKLIDFGLTYRRGTDAAVKLVGTAEYVAPEVVRGERSLTRAVDYYSLGATLFELLCGAPPFVGSEIQVLRAHLERTPVIEHEEIEWAELYPHVRALLGKDVNARLEAFEEFRRAVVGRLTGGIEDLDRSYALARIDSLEVIGKRDAWASLREWLGDVGGSGSGVRSHTVSVSGTEGAGKRYLLGLLRTEAAMRGLRVLTPSDIQTARTGTTAARQPALMWSRLLEMCEREPVLLLVERPTLLPDEERSFVRLAGTQWELMRSRGRVLPLFFVLAVDSTTEDADVLDYLPSEAALKIELGALTDEERNQIVGQFRGSMFDARDARGMATYLGRFEDVGSALQGLQQAVLRSALTFVGQRWKAHPSLLGEMAPSSRADVSFSRDLVASLSAVEQRVAAVVAAHTGPVPVAWVAGFTGIAAGQLPSIVGGSLRRLCVLSNETIAPLSGAVRDALRIGSAADQMCRAHEFLVARLGAMERSVAIDQALAHHLEQLGTVRDAARVHLRLLRAYWSTRPRERPYELIEGVCRSGLVLLERHGRTVTVPTRRHLFCFYLKQWISALWARNLFTHAKPVIDEWTKRLGEAMPASVAPRYVRSVLELEGPEKALASIETRLGTFRGFGRQLDNRIRLEYSLCLHQSGKYREALSALKSISVEPLVKHDKYRLLVYRAMHLLELRDDPRAIESMAGLVEGALLDGCIDEALLMRGLIARARLAEGQPRACIAVAASALRLARTGGLHYRSNLMYRLASLAYGELGDLRRARNCQEKAIQLAETIGVADMAGLSWGRLAATERMAGRYGNARRYFMRATSILGNDGPEWSRVTTHVGMYGTLVLMRDARRLAKAAELEDVLTTSTSPNDVGFYHCWRGLDYELDGCTSAALSEYAQAQTYFSQAGHTSNVAWALARELRVYVRCGEVRKARLMLGDLEALVTRAGSREADFELVILQLLCAYIERMPLGKVLPLIQDCQTMIDREQFASLRIEASSVLLRHYARRGQREKAAEIFMKLRDLVVEITSNVDPEEGSEFVKSTDVASLIEERRVLERRSGDPAFAGSPARSD